MREMASSKEGRRRAMICLALLMVLVCTAEGGREVLLTTQQPLAFAGNMTLMVEDVDPQAGKVWLSLYGEKGSLKSEILGVGGHFIYSGVTRVDITVSKIYAGGDNDLVVLQLNDGILMNLGAAETEPVIPNTTDEMPSKKRVVPVQGPGFCAVQTVLPAMGLLWLLHSKK